MLALLIILLPLSITSSIVLFLLIDINLLAIRLLVVLNIEISNATI